MTYFKRTRFSGIAPAVAPRLLADQFGQKAKNIDFESGRLVATTADAYQFTLSNSTRKSIFFYRDTNWLQWNEDVSVVRGPIPGDTTDRLYWTGETYPRMGVRTTIEQGVAPYPTSSYRLGVPSPADQVAAYLDSAPTVVVTGTPTEGQTPLEVSYVFTFVTSYGEEGPPSAPSTVVQITDAETATITIPTGVIPVGNYNFTTGKIAIYRSNTGSTATQFQFLGYKIGGFAAGVVTDNSDGTALGEVLPSLNWIGPPNDDATLYPDGPLKGLTSLANGVMAGFTGKRFCLSEAFLPHAWPVTYRITTEDDIVAIATTSNGVVALTNGRPYFITGTQPSAMTAIRVDLAQACINTDSVVDMGDYVMYAGPDGLCSVQANTGRIVSEGGISSEQWSSDFYPTTIKAFKHENTYVAFWTDGAAHGGWVWDPRATENALSTLSSSVEVKGGFEDPKTGDLYLITGNTVVKYRGSATKKQLVFKTKKFLSEAPVSMGWLSIDANEYPVVAKVWADETLVASYSIDYNTGTNNYTQVTTTPAGIGNGTLTESVMRMPSVRAKVWEIQVEGTDINGFCLAQSIDEIIGT